MPVPQDRFGYLVGKGGSNLEALKAKTGVVSMQLDDRKGIVRIVGVATAVESARLLVMTQVLHLSALAADL